MSLQIQELLADRERGRPVWVRAPKSGPEFFSGFSRSALYEAWKNGEIRSVSVRQPGKLRGLRLFDLESILNYIERSAANGVEVPIEKSA
jgi:hypothetical protein